MASHAVTARIATRLAAEEEPEFQIAPMIALLLVLLVFFIAICSVEAYRTPEGLDLPNAPDAGYDRTTRGQVIVNVHSSATKSSAPIVVDDIAYSNAVQLKPLFKRGKDVNPGVRLLIRADKNVRYATLKQVLDAAGQTGYRDVVFSVVDQLDVK